MSTSRSENPNARGAHATGEAQEGPPSFVVFSDDWGEHMSSSQHIFRHVAQRHPVLWVNTIGMRDPRLTLGDLRKAWRKVSRMWRGSPDSAPTSVSGVSVCQPFMLPFNRVPLVRAFNTRSVTRTVAARMHAADPTKQIIVATVPNAAEYPELLQGSRVVYYCVDDFTQWPGLHADLVREMEERLIARADVLIATSEKIYARLAASGKPTHLLTHGVDVELFSCDTAVEHSCLRSISHPRAGFFGLFDDRTDQNLIASVAQRMPDFSFVFSGPTEASTERLAALPNVHFTGPVRYAELPSLIKGFDVLFLPYATGEFADTLSPLKLKEYLSTGKPIVSTPIAEARSRGAHVSLASTPEEWEQALRTALSLDVEARRRAILPSLEPESWQHKAERMLEICGVPHAVSPAARTGGGDGATFRAAGRG